MAATAVRSRRSAPAGRRAAVRVLLALLAVGLVAALIPHLPSLNPFASEDKDRTGPAVLKSVARLDEYRAATANLQVIVDLERDAKYLPSFIKGERTLYLAAGNVDASVDFRALKGDAIQVSEDRRSATITLPAPRLAEPRVDPKRSRVVDRDRGLLDRAGGVFEDNPTSERQVELLAQRKLLEAARADPSLTDAAKRNTTQMLTGLLRGLGFTRVTVRFAEPPPV